MDNYSFTTERMLRSLKAKMHVNIVTHNAESRNYLFNRIGDFFNRNGVKHRIPNGLKTFVLEDGVRVCITYYDPRDFEGFIRENLRIILVFPDSIPKLSIFHLESLKVENSTKINQILKRESEAHVYNE